MASTRLSPAIVFFTSVLGAGASEALSEDLPEKVEFNRDIRPILSDNCFRCHGPDEEERAAKLRVDVESSAKKKRRGRFAIVPGDPDSSHLLLRILEEDEDDRMPPPETGKELSAREIALLRLWIEQGAPYQEHWSFVPAARTKPPAVKVESWPLGEIDRFLLAQLEARGLQPSAEADRITLLRRVFFDLAGLPPTDEDVRSFLADERPDAFERVVDRLLASVHYGERMAIYWLDLVRYADTVGYHGDQDHSASPYRDWVIEAFNSNLPFDRFTAAQLAGDLLPERTNDDLIASAYNRLLQTTHEGGAQPKEYLAKYAADRVRNVTNVWMGATVGCAECHNHKYDPYTQRDFYSLAAFFSDIDEEKMWRAPNSLPTRREPEIEVVSPLDRRAAAELTRKIEILREEIKSLRVTAAGGSSAADEAAATIARRESEIGELEKRRTELLSRKRSVMVSKSIQPRTVRVLPRGDWLDESGEVVQPGTPSFMSSLAVKDRRANRLDLARWLTSNDHPQTARVFANRLWYLFFGVGFSKSLDDTGSQGERPTHPALLDWLAVEFVESGWDVKHIVRKIVTSRAYRQSSLVSEKLAEIDPENRLFARQSRFRLPAEMIRDNALAVSGLLVTRAEGGRSRPYQPAGYYAHLNFPNRSYKADEDDNQYRRGVYVHWQRQFLHPMLRAFDAPTREECTAQRPQSNTPLAALTLLNDPTFVESARVFAQRALATVGDDGKRIRWMWKRAFAREVNDREVGALARLLSAERGAYRADPASAKRLIEVGLSEAPEDLDASELAAWTAVARALLNVNESITRN